MKILSTIIAVFFSMLASAQPLNKIVVFGDSLSDNGNFYEHMDRQFPNYPYHEGRFTNGRVWVEWFAEEKSVPMENYAYGGAGVLEDDSDEESALFNIRQEVKNYLADHGDKADERALFIIWIGSNNYLALPDDDEAALQSVIKGIKTELIRLADSGAKQFLIVNLPDLGITPAAYQAEENDKLSVLSVEHNTRLQQELDALQAQYPGIQWHTLNVGEMFYDLFMNPDDYKIDFSLLKDMCISNYPDEEDGESNEGEDSISLMSMTALSPQISDDEEQKDPCEGYLFFDLVHPTAYVHKVISDKAVKFMDDAGVTFESTEPSDEPDQPTTPSEDTHIA